MDQLIHRSTQKTARPLLSTVAKVFCLALATASMACASSTPLMRPSEPLTAGEPSWPEDIKRDAERADRVCGPREAQLLYDYQEGKQDQEKFKTIMGSITGGVGTVGGAIAGVGTYVIKDDDTLKTLTGVTGFITAGLGAAGSVVALVIKPGEAKVENSSKSLKAINDKRAAAHAALKKDPSTWSDADKEAWSKASKELEAACGK